MQCRWVRLAIHGELDVLRADCADAGEEIPVELEVEGGLVECESTSLSLDADRQASAIMSAIQEAHSNPYWEDGCDRDTTEAKAAFEGASAESGCAEQERPQAPKQEDAKDERTDVVDGKVIQFFHRSCCKFRRVLARWKLGGAEGNFQIVFPPADDDYGWRFIDNG